MTYFKVMCERLRKSEIPKDIAARVKSHAAKNKHWNTKLDGIADLRLHLLKRQKWRCAYCQTHITDDKNGLRELDHVMPKKPTDDVSFFKAMSQAVEMRKQTFGYPHFTFEPLNLVITCKQCNTNKGQYDPLVNRALLSPSTYPDKSKDFLWVHPYFDAYSKNIRITKRRLYVKRTEKGSAVIKICKLNKSETLQKNLAAEAYCAGRTGFRDMMDGFSAASSQFHREEAIDAVCKMYPSVPRNRVGKVLDAHCVYKRAEGVEAKSKEIAVAEQLCADLIAEFPELQPEEVSSV